MKKSLIRWRFLLHLLSPPFAPPRTVIFCRFLRAWGKQKIPISLGNQDFTVFCFSSKWCHRESNQGHKDFQSFALPTELWHHVFQNLCFVSVWERKSKSYFGKCKILFKKCVPLPHHSVSSVSGTACIAVLWPGRTNWPECARDLTKKQSLDNLTAFKAP